MARMRTIKPEFWDDDVIAQLTREARLLFMATWNAADDEGLLRWNAAYLKAAAFMYDDDLGAPEVEKLMAELVAADLIFPYQGGKSLQRLAVIIKFHRHQKINRPQPSKLPPPSVQNPEVAQMYARRDGWTCHVCNSPIEWTVSGVSKRLSLDHLHPQSKGGSDYPSNIGIAHCGCNSGKKDTLPDYSVNDSVTDAVSDPGTITDGVSSGKGEVEERNGGGLRASAPRADLALVESPTAQTIVAEWIERAPKRPPQQVVGQASKAIAAMLAEGIDPNDVRRGVAAWMTKGLHPSTLPSVVNEVMNAAPSKSRSQRETDDLFERAARRMGAIQ